MLSVIFMCIFLMLECYAVSANDTGKICYDQLVCEDECCHDMDFGIPYCCSKYTGFIYLGLMVGGGVIIAILVIACYVCMKRTERELEAAARLEAAKAANNACSTNAVELSSETDQTDLESDQAQTSDLDNPPPAYTEVMRSFTRCMSCDVGLTSAGPRSTADVVNILARQYSEGSHGPLRGLPPLVDIEALIANHRREQNIDNGPGLPPPLSQDAVDNKLPSYEECTSQQIEAAARPRTYPINDDIFRGYKATHEILRRLGHRSPSSIASTAERWRRGVSDERVKESEENTTHFVNVSETVRNLGQIPPYTSNTHEVHEEDTPIQTRLGDFANRPSREERYVRDDMLSCPAEDTQEISENEQADATSSTTPIVTTLSHEVTTEGHDNERKTVVIPSIRIIDEISQSAGSGGKTAMGNMDGDCCDHAMEESPQEIDTMVEFPQDNSTMESSDESHPMTEFSLEIHTTAEPPPVNPSKTESLQEEHMSESPNQTHDQSEAGEAESSNSEISDEDERWEDRKKEVMNGADDRVMNDGRIQKDLQEKVSTEMDTSDVTQVKLEAGHSGGMCRPQGDNPQNDDKHGFGENSMAK